MTEPYRAPSGFSEHREDGNIFSRFEFRHGILSMTNSEKSRMEESIEFSNRGTEKLYDGDFDEALKDFDEAIRLNPKNARAFFNRGVLWACAS